MKWIIRIVAIVACAFILYLGTNTYGAFQSIYNNKNVINNIQIHSTVSPKGVLNRQYGDNIWLHRVNYADKLLKYHDKFLGIELDVIYTEHGYIVAHDDSEFHNNLRLEKYFHTIALPNKNYFWLDFKNLTEDNKIDALADLLKLVDEYKILRQNILVESANVKSLEYFTQRGGGDFNKLLFFM